VNKSKKEIIKITAARLFRDRGYAATSMRDLAEAVNLKASSLYNHISGKEELLQEICFETAKRFLKVMEEVEGMEVSNIEKIETLIGLHIKTAMEDVTSITAFNDEWRHLSEPDLSKFVQLRKRYEQRFKAVLQTGIDQGVFQAVDTTVAMHTILSSLRWVYDWYQPERATSLPKIGDSITRMILGGLQNNIQK